MVNPGGPVPPGVFASLSSYLHMNPADPTYMDKARAIYRKEGSDYIVL